MKAGGKKAKDQIKKINEDKRVFRCAECGKEVIGIKALTEARREGCPNCGGAYFEKDTEDGDDYPLR